MQLQFVTTNLGKYHEVRAMLPQAEIVHLPLSLPEVQALDVDDIIRSKAERAYELVRAPVLVEDTGLAFVAWNGLPGALIRWFMDTVGSAGLCQMLSGVANRGATAKCTLDLYDGSKHHMFSGTARGVIAAAPRGRNGFGWYDILIPDGYK